MKHILCLSALFALVSNAAMAIDLNTDALKTMQKQGHEIVEQSNSGNWRSFELDNGQCLQIAGSPDQVGANLVLRNCNNAKNQQWSFDGQNRLVSHGGTCIGVAGNAGKAGANAVMQSCGGQNFQKWNLDGQGRLHNDMKKCLQAAGKPGEPSGNIISTNCGGSPNQVWK